MDKIFKSADEKIVIKACLIHPYFQSNKTFTVKDVEGFAGTKYGLCRVCLTNLRSKQDGWEDLIRETIVSRLKELRKREEDHGATDT